MDHQEINLAEIKDQNNEYESNILAMLEQDHESVEMPQY